MFYFKNLQDGSKIYLEKEEIDRMLFFCLERAEYWRKRNHKKPNAKNGEFYIKWVRNYVLIYTLFHTGRRVSEILGERRRMYYRINPGLRPCDIYFDEKKINFIILKKNHIMARGKDRKKRNPQKIFEDRFNKKPIRRVLNVDRGLLKVLKNWISFAGIKDEQNMFFITRQRVDRIMKDISLKCGIRIKEDPRGKVHAHIFRHSFAIYWLKKNNRDSSALVKLQRYLCHESIAMTAVYTQFVDEEHKPCLRNMFG